MNSIMRVLGIETSCDETGVAIYETGKGLLSDQLHSQIQLHSQYGGVVPELASRDHIKKINKLTEAALEEAKLSINQLDAVAYTAGPGLVGSLMVGASFAKGLGFSLGIPTLAIHHLEAHLIVPLLEDPTLSFPFIALLVSGGHTALIDVKDLGVYSILGETLDDAVGEAFDKTAKLLGLPYPGGAALAQLAKEGKASNYQFPRPMMNRKGLDLSFSGLKTHAANVLKRINYSASQLPDIAYAFQEAAVEALITKAKRALQQTGSTKLVVAGGVGANERLRERLKEMSLDIGIQTYFPRQAYCTDNGAMVAFLGSLRLARGEKDDSLAITVRPRWSLEEL